MSGQPVPFRRRMVTLPGDDQRFSLEIEGVQVGGATLTEAEARIVRNWCNDNADALYSALERAYRHRALRRALLPIGEGE